MCQVQGIRDEPGVAESAIQERGLPHRQVGHTLYYKLVKLDFMLFRATVRAITMLDFMLFRATVRATSITIAICPEDITSLAFFSKYNVAEIWI